MGDGEKNGPEQRLRAIFWDDSRVFISVNFSEAEPTQLLYYYLVLSRQGLKDRLRSLSKAQIKELLEIVSQDINGPPNLTVNSLKRPREGEEIDRNGRIGHHEGLIWLN